MKNKLRYLLLFSFIFCLNNSIFGDIVFRYAECYYYINYNNKKVNVILDNKTFFRVVDFKPIRINGVYTEYDFFENASYCYNVTHLNKGVNIIQTSSYDETEYLIYQTDKLTYLTNKDYLICPINKDGYSEDGGIQYWEYSKDEGKSWTRVNSTEPIFTVNEKDTGAVMYRNVSTKGTYSDILTVTFIDPVSENIKTNIDGVSKTVDETVTLSLDLEDNNYTYQWLLNGTEIAGATASTYHIDNVKMKDAGSYTCRVSNECSEAVSVPVTLTINKCPQTIDFPELGTVTYGCKPLTLSETTDKGMPITYTSTNTSVATVSGNVVTVLAPGETNIIASQAGNDDYIEVTVTRTLTVNKKTQTITFDALPEKTYGDVPFNLAETSSAGLPISYKSTDTNVATVEGNTVTIVGAGTTEIIANQEGNSTHYAATPVSQKLTVNKAPQVITFASIGKLTYGSDEIITLAEKTDKGLTITYIVEDESVAKVDEYGLMALKPGTTTITATQDGDKNHLPAESVQQTITVGKGSQAIALDYIPSQPYGSPDFNLPPESTRGLAITYKSDNEAVSTIDGNIVHIVAAGTCNITATQEGNEYYNAAPSVTLPFTVTKAYQTITFEPFATYTYGDDDIPLVANCTSGADVYFESSDENVARIDGNKAVITGAGQCFITAKTVSSPNYYDTSAHQMLVIAKAGQSIDIENLTDKTYGDAPFELSASASSDREVTFSSSNPNILLITGNTARILGAGDVTITATIAGDENHKEESVCKTLHIKKANLTIKADNKTKLYGDENPELTITYIGFVYDDTEYDLENKCRAVTALKNSSVGTYKIMLIGAYDPNYNINYLDGTLLIEKAPLTITPDDVKKTYGDNNPSQLTYTCTGLKLNETIDEALSIKPTVTTDAKLSSPTGSYQITASGASAQNYEIIYKQGTLTVEKAELDVWLEDETVSYGDEPEFKLHYDGWKLGDGEDDLNIPPNVATQADVTSYPGNYAIGLEGGFDNNYSFNLLNQTHYLTIEKAILKVTAEDVTRIYGQPNPEFALTYEGLKNGETEDDLERRPIAFCNADENSWYGEYPITLSGGYDSRYDFELHDGVLTIVPSTGISSTEVEGLNIRTGNGTIMIGSEDTLDKVQVFNLSGMLIAYKENVSGETLINVSQGIYIVKCQNGKDTATMKVTVK